MAKEKSTKLDHNNFSTKAEAQKAALDKIKKDHGDGTAMLFSDKPLHAIEVISTGSLGLDIALGVGGYPRGRIIELYGLESSGKTTLALHAIAQAQKAGGTVAFIDAEHALDPTYATALGVDVDNMIISQPDHGEQALDVCETLVASGGFDVVVIDSVAALVPLAEIEGDMGDHHVGTQARLMSQALRKLAGIVSKTNTIVIFINQVRMKIGVMFGNPETTSGGNALKFYSSVRCEIRKAGVLKQGEDLIGCRTRVKVVKNKVSPPFREAEFDILFGKGVYAAGELLDVAESLQLVDKAGAWYSYNGERIGQGRDKSAAYILEHPEIYNALDKQVRKHYGLGVPDAD